MSFGSETIMEVGDLGMTGDGDIGISPVLLQAVNQTLDSAPAPTKVLRTNTKENMDVAGQCAVQTGPAGEAQFLVPDMQVPSTPSATDVVPLPSSPSKSGDGHLVIKVIGDSFGDHVNQTAIMSQLRQKLGIKVIVQMENSEGNIVYEDTVSPDKDGCLDIDESINKDNEEVNTIVKSVVNTIRDLSAKLGKQDVKDCPICGDIVTGFHYGVQTCESCKGFFKRTVQNKKIFTCNRSGNCEVNLISRKKCPACRFQKCCDVGMKVEGIREDRSRGGRSSYDGSSPVPLGVNRRVSSLVAGTNGQPAAKRQKLPEPITRSFTQPVIPQLLQQIVALEVMYEETSPDPQPCCADRLADCEQHKFSSLLHITEHRLYQLVKWARQLPNFLSVQTDDQILLLQNSWAELVSLSAIYRSRYSPGTIQLSYGKNIDLQKARETDNFEVISRMLHISTNMRRLAVDKYEYVCLKALSLMVPDVKGLKNSSVVQDYQNKLLDALMIYTTSHFPTQHIKFGELLLQLSEVQRLTAICRVQMQQCQHADGELELLKELCRTSWVTPAASSLND